MNRKALVGFLLILLLAEGGARWLEPQLPGQLIWNNQFTQDKSDQISRGEPVDVVYMGSSVANAGLDPTRISAAAGWGRGYNAALPSTTPSTWRIWSQDLIFPELCPKVYVLGLSIRDYNDRNVGIPWSVEQYSTSAGRLALYGERTGVSIEEQVGEYSSFVAIRSRLRQPENVVQFLRAGNVPEWPATDLTEDGRYLGWDDNDFVLPSEEGLTRLRERVFVNFEVGGQEDLAVRAIIEDAQASGAEVVVALMPTMYEEISLLLPNGVDDIASFERQVRQLGADYGLAVMSFPEMDNDAQLFGDLYHMNQRGTFLFSDQLGAELSAVVNLPPNGSCTSRPGSAQEQP